MRTVAKSFCHKPQTTSNKPVLRRIFQLDNKV